jgi:ribonuclease HI
MLLRGTRVLARCTAEGELLVGPDGRIEVRYKPTDARAYRAGKGNLEAVPDGEILPDSACAEAVAAPNQKAEAARKANTRTHEQGAVIVYADGACSGNPGPAGVGVVVQDAAGRRELSHFLGQGTNNIAELSAILEAAESIEDATAVVRMHTDSRYAIGVLTLGWKAKANVQLVARVKQALKRFSDLEIIYVPGHSGVPLNERADVLAVQAVKTASSTGWIRF